jgi:hypothetical protein
VRKFLAMALVCLSSLAAHATKAVSGNVKDLAGAAVTTRTQVVFDLINCGGIFPKINGTALLAPPSKTFTPDGTGAISGTIYGNDEIKCDVVGNTRYRISILYQGVKLYSAVYNITGAFNLNSAVPSTVAPTVTPPTGDTVYQRLDGGNNAAGPYIPSIASLYDLGSSGVPWRSGYFGTSLTVPLITFTDVVLSRSAVNTLQLSTGGIFIPQTSGQALGAVANRWAGLFTTIGASGTSSLSSVTATDLVASTSVASPLFLSSTANPASAGLFRAAKSDLFNFRNNANSGDILAFSLDASDRVNVGGAAGIVTSAIPVPGAIGGTTPAAGTFTTLTANTSLKSVETTAPSAVASSTVCYSDSTAHQLKCSYNNGSFFKVPQVVVASTVTLGNTAVAAGTCSSSAASANGTLSTDSVVWAFASAPTTADARLNYSVHVGAANTATFFVCNASAASITPTGLVVNFQVIR